MYRKLQEPDPFDREVQAAPEVECACQCKTETDEPDQEALEIDFSSMYQADYFDRNG